MRRASLRPFRIGIAAGFALVGFVLATAVDSRVADDYAVLASQNLGLPLANLKRADMPRDTFGEARANGKPHEATDIMALRGTPVLAIGDGTVTKLFYSRSGGHTVYEFDPSQTYCYYYAHLDRYASGTHEGMSVHKGDVLGYVGSTGDASPDAPHLHLAIFRLSPERHWWIGKAINPYPLLIKILDEQR
ncbi:MAG: M23 family metallopeptidase [Terriglobia bacterium]|jgi:murein DD-endopeptidase MepM/ murein hydrolase activator NlpD